jgi:hypothetical protein
MPSWKVVLGFQSKSVLALLLPVMSVSTSLGPSLRSSADLFFFCFCLLFWSGLARLSARASVGVEGVQNDDWESVFSVEGFNELFYLEF